MSGDGNEGKRCCCLIEEHCATAILKAAVKYAMSILNIRFFIVKNLDAEVPRMVLLLGVDSIGALGMIAWVASPRRYSLKTLREKIAQVQLIFVIIRKRVSTICATALPSKSHPETP